MHLDTYHKPPRLAAWILGKLFPDNDKHTTLGDLAEVYNILVEEKNLLYAIFWYWFQLMKAIPPFMISSLYATPGLFRNYFVVAIRGMRRNKLYAFTSTLSLSIGIMSSILILLYVKHEFSFNQFHLGSDRIYCTAINLYNNPADFEHWALTHAPLANVLKTKFPQVEFAGRLQRWINQPVRLNGKVLRGDQAFVDRGFFEVFSYPIVNGNLKNFFSDSTKALISRDIKEQYFHEDYVVGNKLYLNFQGDYVEFEIAGIFDSNASRSSLKLDILLPFENIKRLPWYGESFEKQWDIAPTVFTFLRIKNGVDIRDLVSNFPNLKKEFNMRHFFAGNDPTVMPGTLKLIPASDWHFDSSINGGKISYRNESYILASISVLLLMVSCANYMNLVLGFSLHKTRENYIRKLVGGKNSNLIKQSLMDTFISVLIAFLIALLFAWNFLALFNNLAGKKIIIAGVFGFNLGLGIILGIILLSLSAGFYPALIMSKVSNLNFWQRVLIVKDKGTLPKLLFIAQFAISGIMVLCGLIMLSQIIYLSNKELGLNPKNILIVKNPRVEFTSIKEIYEANLLANKNAFKEFRNTVLNKREVSEAVLMVNNSIDDIAYMNSIMYSKDSLTTNVQIITAELSFADLFEMEFLAKQDSNYYSKFDSIQPIIINAKFADLLSFREPLGKELILDKDHSGKIVGIVENFHYLYRNFDKNYGKYRSLFELNIRPSVVYPLTHSKTARYLGIKLNSDNIANTLKILEDEWYQLFPNEAFEYFFYEEKVEMQYEAYEKWMRIVTYCAYLALMITCLGLIGVTSMSIARRTKEISVRKSLGASSANILKMINKEYISLIMLSNIIAWPIAFLIMERWLGQFYYKIDLTIWYFIGSSLIGLVIAVLTISAQSYKAASANPVDALRRE